MKNHEKAGTTVRASARETRALDPPPPDGAGERLEAREDHWLEVDLCLEMWHKIARDWGNETLLRLARYAMLEAKTERELERAALERPAEQVAAVRDVSEAHGGQQAAS